VPNEKQVFELSIEGVEVAGAPKENFCSALVVNFAVGVTNIETVPLIDRGVPDENKDIFVIQL
jgi:hypothetical protein